MLSMAARCRLRRRAFKFEGIGCGFNWIGKDTTESTDPRHSTHEGISLGFQTKYVKINGKLSRYAANLRQHLVMAQMMIKGEVQTIKKKTIYHFNGRKCIFIHSNGRIWSLSI